MTDKNQFFTTFSKDVEGTFFKKFCLSEVTAKKKGMRRKKCMNYYPFGLKHKGYNNVTSANGNSVAQKLGYNGKEHQDELGLNWIDFGMRNYDASLGRWMNPDPLAEMAPDITPFRYAYNNPLVFIDPDGLLEWRFNRKTGELKYIGDGGGDKEQRIYYEDEEEVGATMKGSKLYFGAVAKNRYSDGDIEYAASTVDLWGDLPEGYEGAYTSGDLVDRYKAKRRHEKTNGRDVKYAEIRKQEDAGLARRDMIWDNKDYRRMLLDKYGSDSALIMAHDTELLAEMLPMPFGAGDALDALKGANARRAARQAKRKPKFDFDTRKFSKNNWIRYLQKNGHKYKGKGLGKGWIRKAAEDYYKIYGRK